MTPKENEEVRKQVQERFEKGLIREILSQCAIPIVLSLKKVGEWIIYTNSIEITKITIRYRFTLPQMFNMMDFWCGETFFSKIDLKSG